jgi:peptidoglycan/xylan/chitin deacetylase (PgdA/CDA1 family)
MPAQIAGKGEFNMRKIAKVMAAAMLLSMLAASSAWADGQAVAISEAISGAPPGSEGTVLSPVIIAGGQSQTDQNGGPGASAGEAQAQETQTASTGRTIDPSKPMVALTFDDGPQTSVGNQIMDCLAQYGGKATFFMVGERVAAHATEVQRMVAEGHEVANHTMNHKYLQSLGASAIQSQVNACNDAIQSVCGVRPTLLRLPGGNHNATVLANTGMPMIQWNIDTLDWKTRDTASTVSKVLNNVKDGDIVLMHELYTATGNAAVQIIPELVNRGYQLVTVSEMAAAKGYSLEAGKLYSSFK